MGESGARRMGLVLLGVILLLSLYPVEARTDAEIFNMLVENYKPDEAPDRFGSRNGYIPVEVRAMLESIVVNEKGSAVTLQCLQRLTWDDIRLRYRSAPAAGGLVISHATAGLPNSPKLWLPSLVYPRALMVDFDNSMDNSFLIRPNGTLTWQRRVHLMVPCDIQLDSFPWDENTCRASIRQDLDGEVLMLNWTRIAGRPVQAGPHFSINGFELTSLGATHRTSTPDDVTAYMTFWLTTEAVMVRSLVSSFMLLACFLVSAITGRAAPPSAALTALNVWNLVCQIVLLWPLVQSLVVFHMSRRSGAGGSGGSGSGENGGVLEELPKPPALNGNGEPDLEAITSDALPPPPPTDDLGPLPPRPLRRRRRAGLSAHMVDVVSRVLYPMAFIIVVIVFSVVYS